MELTKVQSKYINNKHLGKQILRGKSSTGKTTATLYRLANLKNNYSLRDEDKLLYISYDKNDLNSLKQIYKEIDDENNYISLFSFIENKVDFFNINELVNKYFRESNNQEELKYITQNEFINIIKEIVNDIKVSSIFKKKYSIEFICSEIMWIKASNFTYSEYLLVERKLREKRLKKGSITRQILYNIYDEYNTYLDKVNKIDKYHKIYSILSNKKHIKDKYTHIIIDDCREYTFSEIKFIKSILNEKGSSMTYVLEHELSSREHAWMCKGRKIKDIDNEKCKNFIFREKLKKEANIIQYEYIDLRGRANFEFYKDPFNYSSDVMIKEEENLENLKADEVDSIPMFNEIAAGEPILVNPSMEDVFYMPNYFPRNKSQKFILKVKGDSMEDVNIHDGDMVLIKKQSTAVNNDIVAIEIDGSATLKTLKITKDSAYLKPENSKYDIINLEDKEANILGIALGVIKENC